MTIIPTAEELLSDDELISTSDEDDFLEEVLSIYSDRILASKNQDNLKKDDGIKLELRDISNETDYNYFIINEANLGNSYYNTNNEVCERCRNCKTCSQNQESFDQGYSCSDIRPSWQKEDTNFTELVSEETQNYYNQVD